MEQLRENEKTCVFERFHGKLRLYDNKKREISFTWKIFRENDIQSLV